MKNMPPIKKNGLGANIGADGFKDHYLDKQEVLQKFNISSRTLQTWRDQRIVSHFRIGNKLYYLKEDIDRFIEKRTIPSKVNEESIIGSDSDASAESAQNEIIQITNDSASSTPTQAKKPKSFASVWSPIPPYVVPLLVVIIYLSPFAKEIITGEPISPYLLVLPIIVTIVALGVYGLIQLCVMISRKRADGTRKRPNS
jgi:hypothetical protein